MNNYYFFTHFHHVHVVELDRKSKTTILPVRARKRRRRNRKIADILIACGAAVPRIAYSVDIVHKKQGLKKGLQCLRAG